MIDNVILNNLANQNRAPFDLIKKRAELLDASSNAQLTTKHSKHSESSQSLPKNKIQSNLNSAHNQSTLSLIQNLSTAAKLRSTRSNSNKTK